MRVVVTGGAGFIGSRLVAALEARGDDVAVFDPCLGEAHLDRVDPPSGSASLVLADPRDAAAEFRRQTREADALVHLAALTGTGQSMYEVSRYTEANVALSAWLAELLVEGEIRPGRVVFTSSRAVYGEGAGRCPEHGRVALRPRLAADLARGRFAPVCPTCGGPAEPLPLRESDELRPRSVYGATKVAGEHLLQLAGEAAGIPVARLRLFNVYGPGQPPTNPYVGVLAAFLQAAVGGDEIEVYEDGGIVRDLLYVGDCVDALLAALDRDQGFEGPLNIGSGRPTRLDDLAALAAGLATPCSVPVRISGRSRLGDPRSVLADTSRAAGELGWSAITPLEAGVELTYRWLRGIGLPSQADALAVAVQQLAQRALLAEAAG